MTIEGAGDGGDSPLVVEEATPNEGTITSLPMNDASTTSATAAAPKRPPSDKATKNEAGGGGNIDNDDARTRVLKRGDLVRIAKREGIANVKNRDGGLGRVHRAIPVDSGSHDGGEHPFAYDVDWVLGGRIKSVPRHELRYTTADAEGLTSGGSSGGGAGGIGSDGAGGGGSRTSRRKRRPLRHGGDEEEEDADDAKGAGGNKKAAATKKKKPAAAGAKAKKAGATKAKTKGSAANKKKATTAKKVGGGNGKANAKAGGGRAKKGSGGGKGGGGTTKKDSSTDTADDDGGEADTSSSFEAAAAAAEALYEKHRREFEKSLSRLERVDVFGFFLGDPLPEFDESYPGIDDEDGNDDDDDDDDDSGDDNDDGGAPAPSRAMDGSGGGGGGTTPLPSSSAAAASLSNDAETDGRKVEKKTKKKPIQFPVRPPFNWTVVRRRLQIGRYVLDRTKEKTARMANPEKEPKSETDERGGGGGAHEDVPAKNASLGGQQPHLPLNAPSSTLPSPPSPPASSSPPCAVVLLHPKAVDWETFRSDVTGMCDSAIRRDPDGTSGGVGTLGRAAKKIKETLEKIYVTTGKRHMKEVSDAEALHKFTTVINSSANMEAAMQGKWRKEAFPERRYERLATSNVVCAGLSNLDHSYAKYELETTLSDSFVGLSYTYDNLAQSESWMKSVVDNAESPGGKKGGKRRIRDDADEERRAAEAIASDDAVARAQVQATMNVLLIQVQDRVMTENGTLQKPEVRSANWEDGDLRRMDADATNDDATTIREEDESTRRQQCSQALSAGPSTPLMTPDAAVYSSSPSSSPPPAEVAEQPVWGIDCYTRKNVSMVVEREFNADVAAEFIEKWLLPAINACPVDVAHNLSCAARILEGLPPVPMSSNDEKENRRSSRSPSASGSSSQSEFEGSHLFLSKALAEKMNTCGPSWLQAAAHELRAATEALGSDFFRVHPKGHGSVVLRREGLPANSLVTHYRGEVYPSWRWCEKMDAIEKTQKALGLRPNLPDFYNMALERPCADPRGYGLLFVDASRKAGLGSSFSHSCDPTCEVRVVAVNGQLSLAMTTLRDLERGDELTFDYNAVTESLAEYRFATCLCGHSKCKGSFLHFATADCYQEVMKRNSPIAVRFSSLVKASMKKIVSSDDALMLNRHGFKTAAFGAVSFNHHRDSGENDCAGPLDSMENVPVWLRTFVADTLRYIEYERRALPVALICNHMKKTAEEQPKKSKKASKARAPKGKKTGKMPSGAAKKKPSAALKKAAKTSKKVAEKANAEEVKMDSTPASSDCEGIAAVIGGQANESLKRGINCAMGDDSKPIPGSKPMSTFLFFSKAQRGSFTRILQEQGGDLTGMDLSRAVAKVAGSTWSSLSDEIKQYWKDRAVVEWEMSGGREKARLEKDRLRRIKERDEMAKQMEMQMASQETKAEAKIGAESDAVQGAHGENPSNKRKLVSLSTLMESTNASDDSVLETNATKKQKNGGEAKEVAKVTVAPKELSMAGAEEEGWLNMEQRIQQLTQSLSRVGRVLDWHRETSFCAPDALDRSSVSSAYLRSRIPSPLSIMRDESVVAWLWNHPEGVRCTLLRNARTNPCVTPPLMEKLGAIDDKYNELRLCQDTTRPCDGTHEQVSSKLNPAEARIKANEALLEFRHCILESLRGMEDALQRHQVNERRRKARAADKRRKTLKAESEKAGADDRQEVRISNEENNDRNEAAAACQSLSGLHLSSGISQGERGPHGETVDPMSTCSLSHGDVDGADASASIAAPAATSLCPAEAVENRAPVSSTCGGDSPSEIEKATEQPAAEAQRQVQEASEEESVDAKEAKEDKAEYNNSMDENLRTWIENRKHRYKLQAAADLLLMYAYTSTFFTLVPYKAFSSSPIEVYARELGNEVPRSVVDDANAKSAQPRDVVVIGKGNQEVSKDMQLPAEDETSAGETSSRIDPGTDDDDMCRSEAGDDVSVPSTNQRRREKKMPATKRDKDQVELCAPEDIVTFVTVAYSGEYVLSQLLQWYNGGMGQSTAGLPDMYGCVMLPSMAGCWTDQDDVKDVKIESSVKSQPIRLTKYEAEVRPHLIDWLDDRYKRGSPWEEKISKYFILKPEVEGNVSLPVMGSPVLDFLVSSHDENIQSILAKLKSEYEEEEGVGSSSDGAKRKKQSKHERLQSTMDEGMPAQAVANWVQCENPECLKWRKLPWHVDVDLLPEKFFCKDNLWNPKANSCSAPEETWDMQDAAIAGESREGAFGIGTWFDVQRPNQDAYTEGCVVDTDFASETKRVKIHFYNRPKKEDEWIELGSPRIQPHHSYTTPSPGDVKKRKKKSSRKEKQKSTAMPSKAKARKRKKAKAKETDKSANQVRNGEGKSASAHTTMPKHSKPSPTSTHFPQQTIRDARAYIPPAIPTTTQLNHGHGHDGKVLLPPPPSKLYVDPLPQHAFAGASQTGVQSFLPPSQKEGAKQLSHSLQNVSQGKSMFI